MQKLKVIYVLSNGRSGSTLLELLFGAAEPGFTLGEAQDLYWNHQLGKHSGSGFSMEQCPFWSGVLNRCSPDQIKEVSRFREDYGRGRVLRWRYLAAIFLGIQARKLSAEIEMYLCANEDYFESCARAAKHLNSHCPVWLIDASKDPYRLFSLSKSRKLDIKVVHIIKRPEAFVFSMLKGRKNKFAYGLRMAFRWVVENAVMFRVRRQFFSSDSNITVRYEDLASDPSGVLTRTVNSLDLCMSVEEMLGFREKPNYAISGNKMRADRRPIALDQKWKKELPISMRIAVRIICSIPEFIFFRFS